MLFIILIAISITIAGIFVYQTWGEEAFVDSIFAKIMLSITVVPIILALGVLLSGVLSYALGHLGATKVHTHDTEETLKAISTKDTVEGRFGGSVFASYGYIEGVRTLSYITQQDDGGYRLGYVKASGSVVYEGDGTPRIVTHHNELIANQWFLPTWIGPISSPETYSVYVPTGSVVDGYVVAP